ncbi:MAG: DUF192 domain-containing protein [Paracoccaceae bacterium]
MGFDFKKYLTFAIAVAGSAAAATAGDCDMTSLNLRGDWGQAQFSIEIADDVAERAQGLMNREEMARTAGMMFIYDAPQSVTFWMRNTLIPLDMIFIDPSGLVTSIHENAIPLDETPIPGGQGVQYVLEINGGLIATFGISVGSQVKHPEIDQKNALWPCPVQ